jgi:3-hydroxybutyryl-CoA dehydrogenase
MIIGICGSGIMGRGIALAALQSEHAVVLVDQRAEALEEAGSWVSEQLTKAAEKGRMTAAAAQSALTRIQTSTDLVQLNACDLVVEAITERLDAKTDLLSRIEAIIRSDAVLATNTSSIAIAALARSLRDPSRFAGLHFFNPPHIMKLVEVVSGPRTSEHTTRFCVEFAKGLGKTPVVARDVPGFIVNRVARNYYNEAQRIVMEGAATVEQVDASLKGLGFKMGPFELMDLIGVGTNLDVTTSQWQQFFLEPRFQPSLLQRQVVDAGESFTKS